MYVLQIEHPVPSFDGWKAAFDSDPVGRDQGGVRRHRILRPLDNPNYTIIELDFDDLDVANAFLARLRELWNRVEGTVMTNPQARIVEAVSTTDY
jgi:hypothetical protein